jgi:hypothetical protein
VIALIAPKEGETWEILHKGKSMLTVHVLTVDGFTLSALILAVNQAFEPREAIRAGVVETFSAAWFLEEGSLLSTTG